MNRLLRLLMTVAVVGYSTAAAPAAVNDAQVRGAIKTLVERLYAARNGEGHWDAARVPGDDSHMGVQWGGVTALVTYALLTAGESHQDPRLAPAIEFLRTANLSGTYAVSCRAHVWAALPARYRGLLAQDLNWLARAQHPAFGYFNYYSRARDYYDNSTTQYGVLGAWEAAKRGVPVNRDLWRKVEQHFLRYQLPDGGWNYRADRTESTGSMTAAGLACLFITQQYLHTNDYRTLGQTDTLALQQRIDQALQWFSQNFAADHNPGRGGAWVHYYLYGVERVGLASGIKTFNNVDWYTAGAEYLLDNPGTDLDDMAFTLLFLVRGREPVFINKLQIPDYAWNNRPRDMASLTDWVGDEVEKKMIWQLASIDSDPQDWLDAPMLYLASHRPLRLSPQQQQQIKRYVDLGGMLITTADGGEKEFTDSVEKMLGSLYPQYKLEPIQHGESLTNIVFNLNGELQPVYSVHNGIRHLAIHLPWDVSWVFHSDVQARREPWELFANLFYYATEKGRTRARLDEHYIPRQARGGGKPITVGRASYSGNWDPEPLAWHVQSNFMYNQRKADADVMVVDLADLKAFGLPLVHVTGTEATAFTEAQIASVRRYVEGGGVMLFENAGGGGRFGESVVRMLHTAFPNRKIEPIGLDTPLITGAGIDGFDITSVHYRPYALLRIGRALSPRLFVINFDGQPRVIISAEDLTEGMLAQPVWGVLGYTSESAQRIMTNIVLWAQHLATTARRSSLSSTR